jgi:hypothetical protein
MPRSACNTTSPQRFYLAPPGLAQYEDDCVTDAAMRALRARVVFDEDPAAPVESATVTLHLAHGTEHSEHSGTAAARRAGR